MKIEQVLREQFKDCKIKLLKEETVVFESDSKIYEAPYSVGEDGKVELGEVTDRTRQAEAKFPKSVKLFDSVKFIESEKEVFPVKIIAPGWGSSGYYPEEVLRRDAHRYKRGTHMYWNHPTETEEFERPERDLRDLAGVLESNGRWEDDGVDGAGVYADVKVFSTFKEAVRDMAEHIGISHRASGIAFYGVAEEREGDIIDEIKDVFSVDFVTLPGAGGKIVELFESFKRSNKKFNEKQKDVMELKELKEKHEKLQGDYNALVEEKERLKEKVMFREAKDIAVDLLDSEDLPDVTKRRLADNLATKFKVTEKGEFDNDSFQRTVKDAITAEKEYLAEVTGGKVKNMGESDNGVGDDENYEQSLIESFMSMGYSEDEAKEMAK